MFRCSLYFDMLPDLIHCVEANSISTIANMMKAIGLNAGKDKEYTWHMKGIQLAYSQIEYVYQI